MISIFNINANVILQCEYLLVIILKYIHNYLLTNIYYYYILYHHNGY